MSDQLICEECSNTSFVITDFIENRVIFGKCSKCDVYKATMCKKDLEKLNVNHDTCSTE